MVMKRFAIPFDEVPVRLRQAASKAQIMLHSPAGKVHALIAGELLVWDSLASIAYMTVVAVAMFFIGWWFFNRKARMATEEL